MCDDNPNHSKTNTKEKNKKNLKGFFFLNHLCRVVSCRYYHILLSTLNLCTLSRCELRARVFVFVFFLFRSNATMEDDVQQGEAMSERVAQSMSWSRRELFTDGLRN